MRIHRLANVGNALQFLERKLGGPLMNVGAEDIVDGNLKLTLGLVWVVILRFQIQRAAKAQSKAINQHDVRASLLGWVKSQTINYVNAPEVTDFSRSWQSGCLFMLLIHRYDPAIL
ncbi:calponin homology domain-containing protein, partial [Syncephalis fuscata]